MADIKGKLSNEEDDKKVKESLKGLIKKSQIPDSLGNLTALSATGLVISTDPPTQSEAEDIILAIDETRATQALIIAALRELNTNISGS